MNSDTTQRDIFAVLEDVALDEEQKVAEVAKVIKLHLGESGGGQNTESGVSNGEGSGISGVSQTDVEVEVP